MSKAAHTLSKVTAVSKAARHHARLPDNVFPHGYSLTGLHCGIKKDHKALDLALIVSTTPRPAAAAAAFTRNAFKAAPVLVSQAVLAKNNAHARALVINSGCANAVTGTQGLADAWAMAHATDSLAEPERQAKEGESETLVMSTGVIGQTLPISKIISAIKAQAAPGSLLTGFDAWERAARAFMTTDTFPKLRARTFTVRGHEFRIAGIDKGAGMIHPDMGPPAEGSRQLHATLLGCMLTDAPVSPRSLQSALDYAVSRSFNSISVDGDMSTNDTVLVLANGAAVDNHSVKEIDQETDSEGYEAFKEALTGLAVDLAKLVVRDGEGATKFVAVSVQGAATYADAHKIAARISTSALVKTALYGEDANWGRILAATGSVPLSSPLDPARVSVSIIPSDGSAPLRVLVNGEPVTVDEKRASAILAEEDLELNVELGIGSESATYWTCDLSYEYVRINGDYRS